MAHVLVRVLLPSGVSQKARALKALRDLEGAYEGGTHTGSCSFPIVSGWWSRKGRGEVAVKPERDQHVLVEICEEVSDASVDDAIDELCNEIRRILNFAYRGRTVGQYVYSLTYSIVHVAHPRGRLKQPRRKG